MKDRKRLIVGGYAKMWQREVFDIKEGTHLSRDLKEALAEPGVYVLYRSDRPYYVGKTSRALFHRIWNHANQPHDRYYNFWDFFSAFVVPQGKHRDEVEGILIAAMPTANSSNPRFRRLTLPASVRKTLRAKRTIKPG
jgi:hypothetical protein